MKKRFFAIIIITLATFTTAVSQNHSITNEIKALGLPTIIINTIDAEEPTCDYIEAPEGCMGISRTNDKKVHGSLVIVQDKDTLYNSGSYVADNSGMSVGISGNTSGFYSDIVPYKIKLEKKSDLLCRGNSLFNDKDWRLIKETVGVYNIVGFKLSQLLGMAWTPQYMHCNVIINNKYRGVYLLIEPIKRNSDCRIDVTKSGGYIVERDPYWWNESVSFATPLYDRDLSYRWTFKNPEDKDVTEQEIEYIRDYIGKAEEALLNDTVTSDYTRYFDIPSMARWLMVHDILGTIDSAGSNIYFSKYDSTDASLLTMPVLWDFDSSLASEVNVFANIHNSEYGYFYYLLNHSNSAFRTEYKELWQRIADEAVIDSLQNYLDAFCSSPIGQAVKNSREACLKYNLFDVTPIDLDAANAKEWLSVHTQWLGNEINKMSDINAINDVRITPPPSSRTYTLSGQQLSSHHPRQAIVIRNGRKEIMR